MFKLLDKRPYFWQWDSNQRLTMNGLSEGCEVHFKNDATDEPLTTLVRIEDGIPVCDVPNILLTSSDSIKVYIYVKDLLGNRTVRGKVLTVKGREKPNDYVYTETEVQSIEKLIDDAIKEAIENGEFGDIVGVEGASAYDIAVEHGFKGSEEEWLESLHGQNGEPGKDGEDGEPGPKGDPGEDYVLTEDDKTDIANLVLDLLPAAEEASV